MTDHRDAHVLLGGANMKLLKKVRSYLFLFCPHNIPEMQHTNFRKIGPTKNKELLISCRYSWVYV